VVPTSGLADRPDEGLSELAPTAIYTAALLLVCHVFLSCFGQGDMSIKEAVINKIRIEL
jgi:hypothetical protein